MKRLIKYASYFLGITLVASTTLYILFQWPVIKACMYNEAEADKVAILKAKHTLLPTWRIKAAQGDSAAQFNLSQSYRFGSRDSEYYPEGVEWLRKAAAQNNSLAIRELRRIYRPLLYIPENYKTIKVYPPEMTWDLLLSYNYIVLSHLR